MNIHKRVAEKVDQLFTELVAEYSLGSGDVTPLQEVGIGSFKQLLYEYVKQNRR